jgi:hypothetical protein
VELEEMVARLVKEFERDMAERERKAREALEAAAQITEEDRARMEAEAQARPRPKRVPARKRPPRPRPKPRKCWPRSPPSAPPQAARQAAIEAEEARRFHEALKKPEDRSKTRSGGATLSCPTRNPTQSKRRRFRN